MITRTRSVAGVPAAQRQPKERQQRRQRSRKRQSSDGDDSHHEMDSNDEGAHKEKDDAMVIDINGRGKHPASTQSDLSAKKVKAPQHPGRKRRHVDIRV